MSGIPDRRPGQRFGEVVTALLRTFAEADWTMASRGRRRAAGRGR